MFPSNQYGGAPDVIVAIVNPKSAGGKTKKRWLKLRKRLPPDIQVWETKEPGHAIELARGALKTGASTLVAAGGDGTINEVVNGFFDGDTPISSEAVLGIIPMGTSSDLRRSLELPLDENEAAFVIQNGKPRLIDLMRVRYTRHEGGAETRYAINVTSFGFGGVVAERVNQSRKLLGGKASFMMSTARTALQQNASAVTLTFDGMEQPEVVITNVAVGNGQYHGAGMRVCPNAKMDDGLLDVTVIEAMKLSEMVASRAMLYDGTILNHPKVHSHQAMRIQATSRETTLIEIDGEPLGMLPIEIEMLPSAIRVFSW
jgi:YegS/Rv2252/BmrU family lipid kinase